MSEKLKTSIFDLYSYLFQINIGDLEEMVNEKLMEFDSLNESSVTSIISSETKKYRNILLLSSLLLMLITIFEVKMIGLYDVKIPVDDKFIYLYVIGLLTLIYIYWHKFEIDLWRHRFKVAAIASKINNTVDHFGKIYCKYYISMNEWAIFTSKLSEIDTDLRHQVGVCLHNLSNIKYFEELASVIYQDEKVSRISITINDDLITRIKNIKDMDTIEFINNLSNRAKLLHSVFDLDTHALRQCIDEETQDKCFKLKKMEFLYTAHLRPWIDAYIQIYNEKNPSDIVIKLNKIANTLTILGRHPRSLLQITSKNVLVERNIPIVFSLFAISLTLLTLFIQIIHHGKI